MKAIYIPQTIYTLMPAICFLIATCCLVLPPTIVKWVCVLSLYGYAGVILFLRLKHRVDYI